ncbi:MAG: adenosylcobalamin-dependent ribonucleoside-diphosphate reductase [Bacteroidia bacterium]|nr:adenosylcobalamin-dependent ribonucleoside-diphosphate reductase [Bacteroidia bacterium]
MFVEEMSAKVKIEKKTYTHQEAIQASTEYFKGDQLAATVWVNKYALKDSFGNLYELTPADMHRRIAKEIARIERQYPNPLPEEEIFNLLKNFRYLVRQGGPVSGIGNDFQVASLSNCFVIGIDADSYGGVMKIDQEQVQLMKRRGGVGHDLSHIRPMGSTVLNSALTSTGIVPFMERYSNSTREVAQDGRRGALMLSLSVKHPDAEKFIDAKMTEGKVTGANISVKIDDEFMKAVIEGIPYIQQYPVDSPTPKITKETDASRLWQKIIHNAWKSAEPGVLFWDNIINESIPDCYTDYGFKTVSTNPCGEIPLCPYDSCRLLAINLYSYIDAPFTPDAKFNFTLFKKHVHYAQRIMDDIIDLELEKIDAILAKVASDPEDIEIKRNERILWENIRYKTKQGRRMGIGITAEGDMHAALGLKYCSDNSIDFSVEVHKSLAIEAYRSSVNLAGERGPFEIYDSLREKNNPFIKRIREADESLYNEMIKTGRRNIALLTIAPTGTTSLMTQTTSGIEPVFRTVYKRRRKVNPNDTCVKVAFVDEVGDAWEEYNVFHHKFLSMLEIYGHEAGKVAGYSDKIINELMQNSPYYNVTANDIDWVSKVKMQGAVQKWVDHSISVTVNLPKDITEEKVSEVYRTAWEHGCKGVTVYREGSRTGVLISKDKRTGAKPITTDAPKRPKMLEADVIRFQNNNEKWIAFVGLLDGVPYEIFTGIEDDDIFYIPKTLKKVKIIKLKDSEGKSRYDFQYTDKQGYKVTFEGLSRLFDNQYWNYAKLISGVLRHGMAIQHVVNLITSLSLDSETINTWKNGVERALRKYIPDGTPAQAVKCENCGSDNLVYQEGCLICKNCGTSKCP